MKSRKKLKVLFTMIMILALTGMILVGCRGTEEEIYEPGQEIIYESEVIEEIEEELEPEPEVMEEPEPKPVANPLEEPEIIAYNEIVLALINEPFAIQRFVEEVELNDFLGADFNFELRLSDVELDESVLSEEALEIFNEFTFEELIEAVWVQQFGSCVAFELCGEDYEYCDCEFEELTEPCEDCIINGAPSIWITFFNAGDFTLEVVLTLNEDFTGRDGIDSVSNDTSTISDGIEVEAGTEFVVELDVTVELFEDIDSLVERFEEILEDETLNVPFVAEQPTIIAAAPPIIVGHQPELVPPVAEYAGVDTPENETGGSGQAQSPNQSTPPTQPPVTTPNPSVQPPVNPNPPTHQCTWVRIYNDVDRGSNQTVVTGTTTRNVWVNSSGWAYGHRFYSAEAWSEFRWSAENIFHDNPTTSFRIISETTNTYGTQWVPNWVREFSHEQCNGCGAIR